MKLASKILIAFSLFNISAQSAIAAQCSAKSGAQTVPLLELYTSEGCSSCPPADKWMSNLKLTNDKVVPLAFHVDYWDYIGWTDKFSKAEYSDRQRKTAAFGGAGFVYTPQFVFNGRDFRGSDGSRLNQGIENSLKLASRANLTLDAANQANGEILIKATAQAVKSNDIKNSDIFIAIYENKLVSQVNAGENSGRELKHDYVVRDFLGAYQLSNKNEFSKNISLKPEWNTSNWLNALVSGVDDVDPMTKRRVEFFMKMLTDAFSPSNFLASNPAALREVMATGGESLVRGMQNFAADLDRGGGQLSIAQTDYDMFKIARTSRRRPARWFSETRLSSCCSFLRRPKASARSRW